ncbi:glutaredoxin-1 [Tupaia chinensis]|uniref:Glutaredoxin-1 n=1 Tax=Tupaia chinensis TaxID=246437 RepID=L8Y731_TUPCH|nr:glutaredoxin-1 [Tupaia chinensis]XP_014440245.1 glutaredoxin-1 [Tupaia chinensis]XP_027624631.1 glutaredoxin-1 [Tupaia chinensis]ELV10161.1 Glutaredoxin-1 [Tupaia chinensis]
MAEEFVYRQIQGGKVVVFMKPTCPYCKRAQELLNQLPFKRGFLEFVDITTWDDTDSIQNYFQVLTGAKTVPRIFFGKDCIGGYTDLVTLQQKGELLPRLKQMGALQ